MKPSWGLEVNEDGSGGRDGVDVWIMDSRRPWNLTNVFGGQPREDCPANTSVAPTGRGVDQGQIARTYRTGKGGIIVFDDGDIQTDLSAQREAWFALEDMPEVDDEGDYSDAEEPENTEDEPLREASPNRKRKSPSDENDTDGESDKENARPRQSRRSNSVSPQGFSLSASTNYQSIVVFYSIIR